MIDMSILLPNLSVPEQVLTQVIMVVSGIIGLQWILTASITDSLKKPSFYFFLTALCFGFSAYLIPTDNSSTALFVESTISVNAFTIVLSDMMALVGACLIRIGKFEVYDRKTDIKNYVYFLLAFFIVDSILIFTGYHSFDNFMIVYGLFALFICYFLVIDCFKYKTDNTIFQFLDAFPYALLCFMVVGKVLATTFGIITKPVTEYEEQMLWGYLLIQGLLNINLSMHVIQRQLNTIITASKRDALTHVFLRNAIIETISTEILRAIRYNTGFSVIFLDIDFFKKINDQYGHAAGDHVLKHIAKLLTHNVRSVDFVGRWGGEEFVIVLPATDLVQAEIVAEKLRRAISGTPSIWQNQQINLTASFGISELRENDTNNAFAVDMLIDRADQAMYQAKLGGRNRIAIL